MTDIIIRAEGLGKKYIIGHQSVGRPDTLRDMLTQQASRLVRSARDMATGKALVSGDEREEFWALKDVNFEIKRGEVVGIIGRNGAGKSTLLKVLSRITEPSEGRITIDGRVASLLEVGTGFHPELTGRENIFLNGAILGMTRGEIRHKFDEIVDFAGVEKFLDTPVKRYSSGMYVRLAFSVAAHLEPEILVVDEVLAVGDAEFQKKCLGKMHDVAGQGRTVLFVSHNMTAVQSLCERGLLLQKGVLVNEGLTQDVVGGYLDMASSKLTSNGRINDVNRKGRGALKFKQIEFHVPGMPTAGNPVTGAPCEIVLKFSGDEMKSGSARIGVGFNDRNGNQLFLLANEASSREQLQVKDGAEIICHIDKFPLSEGPYGIDLFLEVDGEIEDWLQESLACQVESGSFFGTSKNCPLGWEGKGVLIENQWRTSVTCGVEAVSAKC
jgi:lipopolysaccharide transport system ATP-binding protein